MKIFPKHYHEDDAIFINKMLDLLHPHDKIFACDGYTSLWTKVVSSDKIPSHRVINVARKTCNTRLREFINKVKEHKL